MKVKSIANYRLLVQRDKVDLDRRSEGGILLETALDSHLKQLASRTGTVLMIGPDCWSDRETLACEVGDRVVYAQYAGSLLDNKDPESPIILNDIDILAVLEDE